MSAGVTSSGVERWLSWRWFFAAVVTLGTLLSLPALGSGFVADDYLFVNRLEQTTPAPVWSLYEFADGAPGQHARLMSTRWIAFPWWMADDFKVRFLRPLSSGLFALDHAVFGHSSVGYHVHSLLWGVLLLVAVGLLLRAVCSSPTWQLAFLLYAVCASRAESVGWISSRHMLVSVTPALFGLTVLVSRKERARPRWVSALGVMGLLLGLGGGEAALSVICFWLAFELLGHEGPASIATRLKRAAPPIAVMVAYAAVYKLGRYGAAGSSAYLDPISAPLTFARALPQRLAILLAEAFVGLPSGLANTKFPGAASVVGLIATLAVGLVLRAVWREIEPSDRKAITWLSLGAGLALIVNAGAFLGPRLLLVPGCCTFVILATVLRYGLRAAPPFFRKAMVYLLAAVHVAIAPLALAASAIVFGKIGAGTLIADRSLDRHFEQHRARGKAPRVYVLSASDPFVGFYVAAARAMRLPDSTAQWTSLSLARATHRFERTGRNELRIDADPGLLHATFEGLFRRADAPPRLGERAAVDGGFVTVLATQDGHPTSISLTLSEGSFDDPENCLVVWRRGRLEPLELGVGQSVEVPWSAGPSGAL